MDVKVNWRKITEGSSTITVDEDKLAAAYELDVEEITPGWIKELFEDEPESWTGQVHRNDAINDEYPTYEVHSIEVT